MQSVFIVSSGENYEGSTILGVFAHDAIDAAREFFECQAEEIFRPEWAEEVGRIVLEGVDHPVLGGGKLMMKEVCGCDFVTLIRYDVVSN